MAMVMLIALAAVTGAIIHSIAVMIGLAEIAHRDPPPEPEHLDITPDMSSLEMMAQRRKAREPVRAWKEQYLPIARRLGWLRLTAPFRAVARVCERFAPYRIMARHLAQLWSAVRRALFPTDAEYLAAHGWRHHRRQAEAARREALVAEQAGHLAEAEAARERASAAEQQAVAIAGAAPHWVPALQQLRALSETANNMLTDQQLMQQAQHERDLAQYAGINTDQIRARYQPASGIVSRLWRRGLGVLSLTPQGRAVSIARMAFKAAPWIGMLGLFGMWQGARADKADLRGDLRAAREDVQELSLAVQSKNAAINRLKAERDSVLTAREGEHAQWRVDQQASEQRHAKEKAARIAARTRIRRAQDVGQQQQSEGNGGAALLNQLERLRVGAAPSGDDPGALRAVPAAPADRAAASVPGGAGDGTGRPDPATGPATDERP